MGVAVITRLRPLSGHRDHVPTRVERQIKNKNLTKIHYNVVCSESSIESGGCSSLYLVTMVRYHSETSTTVDSVLVMNPCACIIY